MTTQTMTTKTKLASLIAATAITAALAGVTMGTAQAADEKEKCYGISKAGMNDCQTPTSSCAGTSKKDGDGHAFLVVPKGTCGKLVGASLTPKAG